MALVGVAGTLAISSHWTASTIPSALAPKSGVVPNREISNPAIGAAKTIAVLTEMLSKAIAFINSFLGTTLGIAGCMPGSSLVIVRPCGWSCDGQG